MAGSHRPGLPGPASRGGPGGPVLRDGVRPGPVRRCGRRDRPGPVRVLRWGAGVGQGVRAAVPALRIRRSRRAPEPLRPLAPDADTVPVVVRHPRPLVPPADEPDALPGHRRGGGRLRAGRVAGRLYERERRGKTETLGQYRTARREGRDRPRRGDRGRPWHRSAADGPQGRRETGRWRRQGEEVVRERGTDAVRARCAVPPRAAVGPRAGCGRRPWRLRRPGRPPRAPEAVAVPPRAPRHSMRPRPRPVRPPPRRPRRRAAPRRRRARRPPDRPPWRRCRHSPTSTRKGRRGTQRKGRTGAWRCPGRGLQGAEGRGRKVICHPGGGVRMVVDRLIPFARRQKRSAPRGAFSPLPWLTA